jgi:hypothetical protein
MEGNNGAMDAESAPERHRQTLEALTASKPTATPFHIPAPPALASAELPVSKPCSDEAHWASMYAKFCKRMLETMNPDIKDEGPIESTGASAPWKQRESWSSMKSVETNNSAEGEVVETDSEAFIIDIRIFHPTREIMTEVIALCDTQSSHSHISPTALEKLGIRLTDTELIKKTGYEYRTNDGASITPRGKIDLTWRAFTSDGRGRNHENTFYIAGDDAPYDGVLLGKDHLLPKNGPARMIYNTCLVTVRERKTAEQKEKAEKAKKEERRKIEEYEKLKKEQMAAAAAAAQAQQSQR